jgi:class I fructose-bisphosphate aldolase
MFGSGNDAWNMGATSVGATIYWGSDESRSSDYRKWPLHFNARMNWEWQLYCGAMYFSNNGFKIDGVDYHTAADLLAQANHLGVTIQADIIKQKLPTNNGGYNATKHGKTS